MSWLTDGVRLRSKGPEDAVDRESWILTFGFMITKYKMDTVLVSADITCLDTGG